MIKDIKKEQHHEINFQWAAPFQNAVLSIIIFFFAAIAAQTVKFEDVSGDEKSFFFGFLSVRI